MVLITKTISDYPVFIYNTLTYMGVSKTHIEKLPSGKFIIKGSKGFAWLIYAAFHINSWCKGIFLVCLFAGIWNFEMEFFDYIAGLLWFLIFIEICIGDWLLMRRYPFFETLVCGLKLQNEIHEKLGERSEEFRQKQNLSAVKKVWFQWIIILMGIAACILQYSSAPKYCIFTNALIEKDTPLVNWLMGFHDVGFIVNAWMLYGADIAIQSVFGGQLQHCLRFMTEEVELLTRELIQKNSQHQKAVNIMEKSYPEDPKNSSNLITVEIDDAVDSGVLGQKENNHNDSQEKRMESFEISNHLDDKVNFYGNSKDDNDFWSENLRPKSNREAGNQYNIDELIMDYRKLSLYSVRMNEDCSYNFLAIHIIAYIQMTCDVFVIFQLLRTPGSEPSDVAYFIEDCIVCMYLLYKCFKSISFVGDESVSFLDALDFYVTKADPRRKYHRKAIKSLPKIVMKLGPSICGPSTVGNASMILLNYYIMVALWK